MREIKAEHVIFSDGQYRGPVPVKYDHCHRHRSTIDLPAVTDQFGVQKTVHPFRCLNFPGLVSVNSSRVISGVFLFAEKTLANTRARYIYLARSRES